LEHQAVCTVLINNKNCYYLPEIDDIRIWSFVYYTRFCECSVSKWHIF